MHTEISIRAMIDVPVAELTTDYKTLLDSLTVANPAFTTASFFGKGFISKDIPKKLFFFRINTATKSISIPRGIDYKYFRKAPTENLTDAGSAIGTGYAGNFKLRPNQKYFFDSIVLPYINSIYSIDKRYPINILLNAECGSGKTIMALALASFYGRRTIVAITTKKIGSQFIAAVKALFPKWSCGWEDGDKKYDITLATYSLLSKSNYTDKYFSEFGHIIMDEYHRCGAETYSAIMEKAGCQFRTSLTATFRRKDGLQKILKLHAGAILEMKRSSLSADVYPVLTDYSINEDLFRSVDRRLVAFDKLEEYTDVVIRDGKNKELDRGMIASIDNGSNTFTLLSAVTRKEIVFDDYSAIKVKKLGTVSSPMVDTEVSDIEERTNQICDMVKSLSVAGRKTVVLSKRKEQLFSLEGKLRRRGIRAGVFVSEKSKEYKDFCKKRGVTIEDNRNFVFNEANIILGIDKLAEEGMDVPEFDTLVYLHPIKDIEQSIGRILREIPGKKKPVAIYLIDKVNSYDKAFYGKGKGARAMFSSLGHKVCDELSLEDITHKIQDNEI